MFGEELGVDCTSLCRGVAGREEARDATEPEVEPRKRLLRSFLCVVEGGLWGWATRFEGGEGVSPKVKPMLAALTIDPLAQSCERFD